MSDISDRVWSSSFARVTVTVTPPALRITSTAADLSSSFAPEEAVSLFNVTVMNGDTPASAFPLPASLGGVTVTIADSAGVSRLAPLYGVFASKGQINLVIPGSRCHLVLLPTLRSVNVKGLARKRDCRGQAAKKNSFQSSTLVRWRMSRSARKIKRGNNLNCYKSYLSGRCRSILTIEGK